jgi:hypothetical protein
MDEHGNYLYDEDNQRIKLSKEHIEYLRSANLLEEKL